MKKRKEELSEQERIKTLDALYTAASSVSGRSAVKLFLRDLLTESERIMLGRRILIARLLIKGDSHDDVREKTGAGYATIARVHRWLVDEIPGYEDAILGMESAFKSRETKKLYRTSALFRLKKKYPLHFLFFPDPRKRNI